MRVCFNSWTITNNLVTPLNLCSLHQRAEAVCEWRRRRSDQELIHLRSGRKRRVRLSVHHLLPLKPGSFLPWRSLLKPAFWSSCRAAWTFTSSSRSSVCHRCSEGGSGSVGFIRPWLPQSFYLNTCDVRCTLRGAQRLGSFGGGGLESCFFFSASRLLSCRIRGGWGSILCGSSAARIKPVHCHTLLK